MGYYTKCFNKFAAIKREVNFLDNFASAFYASSSCMFQRKLYSSGFPINRYHPPFLSIRSHPPPSTFPFSLTRGLTSIPGTHFQSNERIYTSKRPHQTETNLPWNPCPAISCRPNQQRDKSENQLQRKLARSSRTEQWRSSGVKGRPRKGGGGGWWRFMCIVSLGD